MRLSTIGMLATEYAHRYGCTHEEAVTEIAATHRLAEIPEMPVLVFEDGGVLALGDHSDPARHARHRRDDAFRRRALHRPGHERRRRGRQRSG